LGTVPNVKKAKPNIIKLLLFFGFGMIVSWELSQYYVEFYGGTFPNRSILTFAIEHKWVAVGFIAAMPTLTSLYEVYRKR